MMQSSLRNLLLRACPADGFDMLAPLLEPIVLSKRQMIAEAGMPADWAVFPETGLISIVNQMPAGRQLEVGIVGNDGMSSLPVILGTNSSPHRAFVRVEGRANRLPAAALRRVASAVPGVQALLLRYVQAFVVQVAQTAVSNGSYTIEERLARWLLLVHDRMEGHDVPLTHEFLSVMLGVRRTGVTLAIHVLEGGGMIRARRGVVTVLDREKLKLAAADGYGPAEREYERLIGPLQRNAAGSDMAAG